jgi:hypothetical protein
MAVGISGKDVYNKDKIDGVSQLFVKYISRVALD